MTPTPLPTWFSLGRALLRPPRDVDLAAPWRREGEIAGWLSRSAWSLALIALWRKRSAPASPVRIWMPQFFCNESLVPLRQIGVPLVFYPLDDNLVPDMRACRALADANAPDIFVLVHYFGQPAPAAAARDFCARHGAWLIEDAAHVLRPVDGIGECGDAVLYSPHKHLPVPDGAVLVVRPDGPGKLGTNGLKAIALTSSWPGELIELYRQLSPVKRDRARSAIWLLKRLLQKAGIRPRHRPRPFDEPLNRSDAAGSLPGAPFQSRLSRRLLAGLLRSLDDVGRERRRHQLLWDALLLGEPDSYADKLWAAERARHREWIPYLASYRVDVAAAATLYEAWSRCGLIVTTWPDLPPEVTATAAIHATAWRLRHSRVYLPLHQSLSAREIVNGARRARPASEGKVASTLRLAWNKVTREQWDRWMAQAGRSNLLQSWAYGEAKSIQGWDVKRGAFLKEGEAVAFVQVLQRGMTGLFTLSRINRGPLWLRSPSPQEEFEVWKELAALGRIRRGRLLAVAPEMSVAGLSLARMAELGFRQYSPQAYESVWVDLREDIDALRKQLDGKWRNMLSLSEKAGLTLEIANDRGRFAWMIARYRELMQERDFNGPPIDLLMRLHQRGENECLLPILCAVHEGETVAAICLAIHGAAATYLLGWNGAKGRKLRANQFLLWRAIVYLKQSGLSWFDLGGINEERTPGISAFKLGLNGQRYELIGEYWKW